MTKDLEVVYQIIVEDSTILNFVEKDRLRLTRHPKL